MRKRYSQIETSHKEKCEKHMRKRNFRNEKHVCVINGSSKVYVLTWDRWEKEMSKSQKETSQKRDVRKTKERYENVKDLCDK